MEKMFSLNGHFKKFLFFLPFVALVFLVQPVLVVRAAPTVSSTTPLTSGTSWMVPADWNSANNTIEVIGGGGGGKTNYNGGGGGGAYSKISNVTLTSGASITYAVGAGGTAGNTGGNTWFNAASLAACVTAGPTVCVGAKGGAGGTQGVGGSGGVVASGVGTVKYSGGSGTGSGGTAGGGGGAGGPNGNGANGGTTTGTNYGGSGGGASGGGTAGGAQSGSPNQSSGSAGGNNFAGSGSGAGGAIGTMGGAAGSAGGGGGGGYGTGSAGGTAGPGGAGGAGTEWDSTHGSGGGGGGGGWGGGGGTGGGAGGLYGGGGGGATGSSAAGGAGAKGIVVITYSAPLTIYTSASGSGPLYSGNSITYTFTRNGPGTYAEVPVTVTIGGTGVAGTDYSITNVSGGVVTIPANTYSITVTITALGSMTAAKTFSLTIPSSASYNVASPSSYSVNMAPAVSSQSLSATFSGNQVDVVWSSQYTYSCTVTGPNGFSVSDTSGSQTTTPGTSPAAYTLSCDTPVGTQQTTATALAGSSLTALKSGMVSYWTLDSADIIDTTANDVSTNFCNPGTLTNAPTATTGHYGDATNALSFNGTNQYVSVLYNPSLNPTGDYGISVWVKPTNVSGAKGIISRDANSYSPYLIYQSGAAYLFYSSSNGSSWNIASAQPLGVATANTWQHLVVTRSGNTYIAYRNGVQTATWTSSALPWVTSYPLVMGRQSASDVHFNGSIDELIYYNRAISASEVSQLYTLSSTDAASLHGTPPPAPQLFPIVESIPSYSMQSLNPPETYGLPIYSNWLSGFSGNADGGVGSKPQPLQAAGTPSDVSAGWYAETPSPLTCYVSVMGKCMWLGGLMGTRIGLVTATPQISGLPAFSAGVDLVSNTAQDICGRSITHWAYATSSPTYKVPKYTPVQANYSCQPTQEYLWAQYRDYGCWPVSCEASTVSQRIFRFADRLKFNGVSSATLHNTVQTQTVADKATFNLQCGGYLPEEGTERNLRPSWPAGTDGFAAGYIDDFNTGFAQASDVLPQNVGLPAFYGIGRVSACWNFCYWPWTWAYYNVASTTYYHVPATINVEACNDNEIVVNNVCTACAVDTYRSGNSCIGNPPPTATIDAGMGNGVATTTVVGTPVTITAIFTAHSAPQAIAKTDTITSSQNWTVPQGVSTAIQVEVWGSGGGGGGDGGSQLNGSVGGASTFLGLTAGGGRGGTGACCAGGVGGTASGGDTNTVGSTGGVGGNPTGAGGTNSATGSGVGGAGVTSTNDGNDGTVPGGGGSGAMNSSPGGAGGGSGGYVKKIYALGTLAAGTVIPVVIGTGGAGGAGTHVGGGGANGKVVITYSISVVDALTATAINDDSTGNSVNCTNVTPLNNPGCETKPDATKTYTFTSILNDLGLHTYSAQIKTNFYLNYNGYASVDVTFTCWPHSTQQDASCVCDPHYSQVGNSCVLDECTNNIPFPGIQATVPPGCIQNPDFTCQEIPGSGYVPGQGECAPPGQIADLTLKVSPPRVKKGNSTLLTWTGTNVPAQCTVSSNPSITGLPKVLTSTITGNSTGASIGPIMQNTLLTLTCTSITANGSAQKAVGIVPVIIEI